MSNKLFSLHVNKTNLLKYTKVGKETREKIRKRVRQIINIGRRIVRQKIGSEFETRTGFLRRQRSRIGTKVTISAYDIRGRVTPIPHLLNIFEEGARLSNGRGFLRPRPVVAPARAAVAEEAPKAIEKILADLASEAHR